MNSIWQKFSGRISRFAAVGVANATISFGLLNILYYAVHLDKVTANIIATSCAVIFSFLMNRNFVFLDKTRRKRHQVLPFVLVTISGSIFFLNGIYILALHLLRGHDVWLVHLIHSVTGLQLLPSFVEINFSAALGAAAAMFWNYNGYRLFVFKNSSQQSATRETHETKTT